MAIETAMPAPTDVPPFLAAVLNDQRAEEVDNSASQDLLRSASEPVPLPTLASSTLNDHAPGPSTSQAKNTRESSTTRSMRSGHVGPLDMIDLSTPSPTLLVPPLNFDMICASRQRTHVMVSDVNEPIASTPTTNSFPHHSHTTNPASTSGTGGGAIYRSGFPNERNYAFLHTLHLRSVVYLAADDVQDQFGTWLEQQHRHRGLRFFHFRLLVNKEPFAEMDPAVVTQALRVILDRRNHPLLLHCNKGKYRVGVMTALLRRLQGWNMTSIYDEYARFAGADRVADEEFIDMFPLGDVRPDPRFVPDWLPRGR